MKIASNTSVYEQLKPNQFNPTKKMFLSGPLYQTSLTSVAKTCLAATGLVLTGFASSGLAATVSFLVGRSVQIHRLPLPIH